MPHKKGKKKKSKSKFLNKSSFNILTICAKIGNGLAENRKTRENLYQQREEEKRVYRKYLKWKEQPPHFKNKLEKIITLSSIVIFTILLIDFLNFLGIIKNGFVIFGLVIYVAFTLDFFLKALYAPLNIKDRIILTEKDKEILERRRKRKEAELKEELDREYKRQQEDIEKQQQKEKQNEILVIFAAIAALGVASHLDKSNKVYVKGHYRNKPKRKRR